MEKRIEPIGYAADNGNGDDDGDDALDFLHVALLFLLALPDLSGGTLCDFCHMGLLLNTSEFDG